MNKMAFIILPLIIFSNKIQAQLGEKKEIFTHEDTLRGSLNPNRTWWNVLRYDITIKPDFETKTIEGICRINIQDSISPDSIYQIDLQEPLIIDSVKYSEQSEPDYFYLQENISFVKASKNTWNIVLEGVAKAVNPLPIYLTIYYHGKPREAKTPPWDGGWIWKKDSLGRPWMSVACQGHGASAWYPSKDHQSDEPDNGASITIIVPDTLVAVGNGRLVSVKDETINVKKEPQTTNHKPQTLTAYTWEIKNPINNYNIIPYIGKYVNFTDTLHGEKGVLDLSYWVLDYNLEKAKKQFAQAKDVIHCLEYWWGPYPFYDDSYKLVEAPHLGMEHQSAVAYGNKYNNGYLGTDLSHSGWGLRWDFIIEHESAHEWFGNSITTNDLADAWVHEGFANFSETLYTEWLFGKEAGNDYNVGIRQNIINDVPIIGPYHVNQEGSDDMYYKGGNILQAIRHVINDDSLFRKIMRGLSETFYHKTVNTADIENFIIQVSGIDFRKTFDQYLLTTQIPTLNYYFDKKKILCVKWDSCVAGFNMPLTLKNGQKIYPTTTWKKVKDAVEFDEAWVVRNYYLHVKKAE